MREHANVYKTNTDVVKVASKKKFSGASGIKYSGLQNCTAAMLKIVLKAVSAQIKIEIPIY